MIYHPTIIIFICSLGLIISRKHKKYFAFIALFTPVITYALFYNLPLSNDIKFGGLKLFYEGSYHNKIVGTAFILALFFANFYGIIQNKKIDVILGNIYAALAFFALLARDFVSMFIGLELMMVFSSMIIFIGGERDSLRSAQKYFLTHLISSSMIIIAIAYLIVNNNVEMVLITSLIEDVKYSNTILFILLSGALINIAIFPFSGWMVHYYPKASPTGFLYLISFATKVSLMMLIKLFAGYENLKYFGVVMILYAALKGVFEDNLFRLLCYLSIMSMGFMLFGIASADDLVLTSIVIYLSIHIICKLLLSMSLSTVADITKIETCSNLKMIDSKIINIALLVGIIVTSCIPLTSTFYIKSYLVGSFSDSYIGIIVSFLNFMVVFALPWKKYYMSKEVISIDIDNRLKLALILLTSITLIIGFSTNYLPEEIFNYASVISVSSLKQVIITSIALIISISYTRNRYNTKPINLVEWIGAAFFYLYIRKNALNPYTPIREKEAWDFKGLERQILKKFSAFYNQRTAIFVVFIVLITMLITFVIKI